jgi:glycosyltransferase involved in cell wall biosynthesis
LSCSQLNNIPYVTDGVRILYLYSSLAPFVTATLRELSHFSNVSHIDVIHWNNNSINASRYVVEPLNRVRFYQRTNFNDSELLKFIGASDPHIIYISGWMDKGYIKAVNSYRAGGGNTLTVCGIDDQWEGRLRQRLGQLYFRLFYRRTFDFMWVSGKPQYHFAQRFGYRHERIISNLLSADTALFSRLSDFSKRFVFIGRFDPVKGLDLLLDAYTSLPSAVRLDWPLVLIGDGELRAYIESRNIPGVTIKPFLQPEELVKELSIGGVACMPSTHEQWGVAIHEMALLGYPLILSSACGAATEFLISGYNGSLFERGNSVSLRNAMLKIANMSFDDLRQWASRSNLLAQRISTHQSACSLLSVLELSLIS